MKIKRETDYAIRAIRALINARGIPLISKEIADREHIPQTYILSIMGKLKNNGIVDTVPRHGDVPGGYRLLADPDQANIYDVVHIFEGDLKINACLREQDECPNRETCTVHLEMERINEALIEEMKRKSITEILNEKIPGKS
ncbi:MAG: Rrf2 family transcriptional regulator [Atopobium sp.]|nr:Rrf2 family transcriptional regulator [Atopobium sp.]